MNRKIEIIIGISIIVVFIILVGKNVFAVSLDESVGINKLKTAIKNQDTKYLAKHLEIEGYDSKLSTEDIEKINILLQDEILQNLDQYYNETDLNIYIKKAGKEHFILDKYVLVLKPYKLILESDTPKAEVYIDGEKTGKIDENYCFKCSCILPGKHKIELKYNGEYTNLEEKEEILFFDEYDAEVYHSIYLEGEYIIVDSNYPEAKLFVNDKDIGKTIEEIEHFGPIPLDGSIVVQAKINTPQGVLESEKIKVNEDYDIIYLEIIDEKDNKFLEDLLDNLIMAYEQNMVYAINENDFGLIEPYILEGSPLYDMQQHLVENLNEKGIEEELLYYEIIDVDEVDDHFDVEVYEKHKIIYSDETEEVTEHNWTYTVVNVDNDLLLYDIE